MEAIPHAKADTIRAARGQLGGMTIEIVCVPVGGHPGDVASQPQWEQRYFCGTPRP